MIHCTNLTKVRGEGGKDLSVPDIYIYIYLLTLYWVTNLYCKINLGDKFVLYLINSFQVQSWRGANHKCHFVTSAPDEKTCEKSEFQGHVTGYREMGKAHHMMSTAGNGSERPISAAQAKMRLSSLLLSVLLRWKCWSTPFSSLQLPALWDSFCAAHELWPKKKDPLFWGVDHQNRFVGLAAL